MNTNWIFTHFTELTSIQKTHHSVELRKALMKVVILKGTLIHLLAIGSRKIGGHIEMRAKV